MRSFLAVVAAVALLLTPGCNSTWWQNFKNDPVKQVDVAVGWAQTAVAVATVTFNAIAAELPPETANKARQEFSVAVITVHHAIAALQDAVEAAAEAGKERPDFSAIITDLLSAVDEVKHIIDQYHVSSTKLSVSKSGDGSFPPLGYTELQSHIAGLKRSVGR